MAKKNSSKNKVYKYEYFNENDELFNGSFLKTIYTEIINTLKPMFDKGTGDEAIYRLVEWSTWKNLEFKIIMLLDANKEYYEYDILRSHLDDYIKTIGNAIYNVVFDHLRENNNYKNDKKDDAEASKIMLAFLEKFK